MNSPLLLSGLLLLAAASALPAQTPATNAVSRPARPAPLRSPDIAEDRTVTFRLRAPGAKEVHVAGQWPNGRTAMTQDTNGVWSVRVGPIDPGVWEYSFQLDGLSMIDPANPAIKPMREPRTSILHLAGSPPLVHDFQDVPHGVVRRHTYRSQVLGRLRDLSVYTPPSYERRSQARYPVLYLQHGAGDNQDTWVVHGKAHWILDNLIAQGRAREMVVVMMDGHAAVGGGPAAFSTNTALFERDLLQEVMPMVEKNYRLKKGAAHRAIAGLSMGGGQSLTIGLNHPDLFAWVAGFSSAAPAKEAVAAPLDQSELTNRRLKLLWIACGRNDFLLQRNQDFVALLSERKIRHEWLLTEGDHSWPVWRRYLADLAPRLFQ